MSDDDRILTAPFTFPSAILYSIRLDNEIGVVFFFLGFGMTNSRFSMFLFTSVANETFFVFSGTRNAEYENVRRFFQFFDNSGLAKHSSMHCANLFAAEVLAPLGTLLRTLTFDLQRVSKITKSSNGVSSPLVDCVGGSESMGC